MLIAAAFGMEKKTRSGEVNLRRAIAIGQRKRREIPLKLLSSSFSAFARLDVGRDPASALRLRDSMECGGEGGKRTLWPFGSCARGSSLFGFGLQAHSR